MEMSERLDTVRAIHAEATSRALFFQHAEQLELGGRTVLIDGKEMVSFSSCSYLGLEAHPALIDGTIAATRRYGTQFSSSRGYLSAPMYAELEAALGTLFGGHTMVTSSTSIGHQVAIPALITEKDALVMDHQVHHSVHSAASLARQNGATVELVRHNALHRAVEVVARLARRHRTVWFATDGVFSMYGDLVSLSLLQELLDVAPNVRLYVDDAHGMSWAGTHGRGSFLSRMPMHERMVVATSLNKAFSAAGGCLIFPSAKERDDVMQAGGPMVFSGPVQPPMLGAALASARLHLSDEITALQQQLRQRVDWTNAEMARLELPLLVTNEAPIFFVRLGLPRVSFAVAERMRADGWFVNVSAYPAVPMKRSGVRFTCTANHTEAEISGALESLARHIPAVFAEEKVSRDEVDELFADAIPAEARGATVSLPAALFEGVSRARPGKAPLTVYSRGGLLVQHERTIHSLARDEWDQMFGTVGACSWDALALAEKVFHGAVRPEHSWDFHYVIVRAEDGHPIAATFFTTALSKDDMLMRAEVSRRLEELREDDPYYLTSKVVCMGSGFSEGNHLHIDRRCGWRPAVVALLSEMSAVYEAEDAAALMLRDLPTDDTELTALLLERGFVQVPMFKSHTLEISWADEAGWLASLRRKRRAQMRRILQQADRFEVQVHDTLSPQAQAHLYRLYRNVSDRKRRLNVFPLPEHTIGALLGSPAWEVVTLTLPPEAGGPEDGRPVAFYGAHRFGGEYAPFLCGLDYDYVKSHGAYRALLVAIVRRAAENGWTRVHLGMDADTEKERLGSVPIENSAFVQVRDHFHGALLQQIVAEVGVSRHGA